LSIDPHIRRLALSCLLLGFQGPTPPRWLLDCLADGLGGVVLFGSNLRGNDVRALTESLRKAAGQDIVVALDEEGGDVTRLDDTRGSASPGAAALGFLDDPVVTEQVYGAIGARLAHCGVTLDLAPVADVNLDPLNPVIGVRSFGADPEVASRQVAAAVRGLQHSGTAACVKHFPGHGATRADSHHQVATLDRSRAQLESVEYAPFRAAIAAGARSIMTGHLLAPALDAGNLATVSAAITTGVLRDELGFTGTVVTDALEMRALSGTIGMLEGFVRALAAGADAIETGALEHPQLVAEIPAAVARAIDGGQLTLERLRDAAARTARLAGPGDPSAGFDPDIAAGAAARCIEVLGTLPPLTAPLVLECRPPGGMASGELPWTLAEPLAALVRGTQVLTVRGPDDLAAIAPRSAGRSLVAVVRDPARYPWQQQVVAAAQAHPAAVLVDVGWPGPSAPQLPAIRTRGVAPGLLAAAAAVLAGADR
jgi:beta-N-acetylhexosaminidase